MMLDAMLACNVWNIGGILDRPGTMAVYGRVYKMLYTMLDGRVD